MAELLGPTTGPAVKRRIEHDFVSDIRRDWQDSGKVGQHVVGWINGKAFYKADSMSPHVSRSISEDKHQALIFEAGRLLENLKALRRMNADDYIHQLRKKMMELGLGA